MSYTIENPKLVGDCYFPEENNFTGVVKDIRDNICYFENGKKHRIDGPAVICSDVFVIWYYNDTYYGISDDFTVESWIEKWKLEIFK